MIHYIRRPADTWRLVVRAGQSLTVPAIDPEREDAAVEELAAASVFGRAAASVGSTVAASWRSSALRRAAEAATAAVAPLDRPGRVRCAGLVVLVAAAVALTGRLAQASPDRFTWALPAVAALVGLVMTAMAVPIAHALQDRRR